MRFRLFGEDHEITKETVLDGVKGQFPELKDGRHKYFVNLEGRRFPIKQLLANATGLNNPEFPAQYAHRILKKLDFEVEEFGPPPPRASFSPRFTPASEVKAASETQNALQFAVTVECDEDGFYLASCPALVGCHSQGRNRDEALGNIVEAIRGYLASMQKHGETIPDERWEVVDVVL